MLCLYSELDSEQGELLRRGSRGPRASFELVRIMHPCVLRSGVLGVEIITIGCEEELTHSLTHSSLTHSLTSLTHSLTHSLKRSANLASLTPTPPASRETLLVPGAFVYGSEREDPTRSDRLLRVLRWRPDGASVFGRRIDSMPVSSL